MKKFLLLIVAVSWIGASAANGAHKFDTMRPTRKGVSDAFRNYSKKNPKNPFARSSAAGAVDLDGGMEVPNQFYIQRGGNFSFNTDSDHATDPSAPGSPAAPVLGPSVVTPAPSTMFNQTTNGTLPATVISNYTGLGDGFNGWTNQFLLPPDTTMAVGANQIVQWVNVRLTIMNKTTGALVLPGSGYIDGNQIWQGLPDGSVCKGTNRGDPVLQYDRMASRWILSQFAFNISTATNGSGRQYPSGPYAMCFAVSQSNDAAGSYNLYEFTFSRLPDYPKLGVWPDAYYWTSNDFQYSTVTGLSSYQGSRVCAMDRAAMIAGNAPVVICASGLSAEHFASLPVDFEGTIAPPVGSTAYILSNDWFTKNAPPYFVKLRRFHPDFITPSNSTFNDGFGGAFDTAVTLPFDNSVIGACGDNGGACVPQPATVRVLDTLSMRAMYRLAYRNLGAGRESLVFTETVDPAGGAVAGIQMVEIRNPSANPPQIYNNVGFNPDATNRWMGAAATDKLGDIALGYSVSSASKSPSIRIAGRLRNDIKSTLRGEIEVKAGTANQVATAQRWGDYSTMQIDPDDDCTFWYTTEYTSAGTPTSANWATQIIGFKFNNCQ
jgi:hypothetical protein